MAVWNSNASEKPETRLIKWEFNRNRAQKTEKNRPILGTFPFKRFTGNFQFDYVLFSKFEMPVKVISLDGIFRNWITLNFYDSVHHIKVCWVCKKHHPMKNTFAEEKKRGARVVYVWVHLFLSQKNFLHFIASYSSFLDWKHIRTRNCVFSFIFFSFNDTRTTTRKLTTTTIKRNIQFCRASMCRNFVRLWNRWKRRKKKNKNNTISMYICFSRVGLPFWIIHKFIDFFLLFLSTRVSSL